MNGQPLIVGAGPTGLAAALFLKRRGIVCRVVDQSPEPATESRALAVNPRTLEILDTLGLAPAFEAQARPIHRGCFYTGWEPIADFDFAGIHPRFSMCVIPQATSEKLLTEALAAEGIHPERGVRLDSLTQHGGDARVVLIHSDGRSEIIESPVVLGADGAHSTVRESQGIEFEGSAFPEPWPLFDVEMDDPLDLGGAHISLVEGGMLFLLAVRPGLWRVMSNLPDPLAHLPIGARQGEVVWNSSFHISHRLANRLVSGRVALAGDAAHLHSPVGARGMNLGIEDAFVFASCAADALTGRWERLGEYERLRHPVQKQVVDRIHALTAFVRGKPDLVGGLRRFLLPGLTKFGPTADLMAHTITGLDHELRCKRKTAST